jgi:AraC family transcriptional regulator of adaptative response/methylated-DNA-[protein]-cysteine methyltransferase
MSDYDRVEQVIRYLQQNFREQPELKDIAAHMGLSEYHFQRLFKQWAGISPKRFLQYLTAEYARERLQTCSSVLETAYDAGLSGPGRLHDLTVNVYGMTPGEIKGGGDGLTVSFGFHETPFGDCLIGVTERGICGLDFLSDGTREDALFAMRDAWPNARFRQDVYNTLPIIDRIFGENGQREISLLLKGTNFQIRVWEALLKIPQGALITYGNLARGIGQPAAARAVGNAVGCNPIAYLIPCHRVIRNSGVIGDYRWNTARKHAIIAWEAAQREFDEDGLLEETEAVAVEVAAAR